ncbi:putative polyketide cyclase/dehydrase, START-like domain-containing protein [Lupinus albus]|uniref:Putative polyketide cyclase/dehydrase, START-like domain-containing protein n=1 Tax=Lupinus albus TaxID=3870 RepID=A0A6A4PLC2_LUPAL|nr:putative polyketide cyclase/dehydrase, START-like domain-containing protein [Lupinus albus]
MRCCSVPMVNNITTEMEQDSSNGRWEGKVSAKLKNTSAEQAWALVKDFFNLHKRFPTLATCYGIHGTNGEPGCIRYCAGSSIPSNGSVTVSWSKEKLVAVDDVDRILNQPLGSLKMKNWMGASWNGPSPLTL